MRPDVDHNRLARLLVAAAEDDRVRIWVMGQVVVAVKSIANDRRYRDAPKEWSRLVAVFSAELRAMAGRPIRGRIAELRHGGCVVFRDGRDCLARLEQSKADRVGAAAAVR